MKKVRNTPTKKDSPSTSKSSSSSKKSSGGSSLCSKIFMFITLSVVGLATFLTINYSSLEHGNITKGELGKEYFRNKQGLAIYTVEKEVPNAKAALLLVHGHGEHQGRYSEFSEQFVKAGISFYALDLQGHGRSDGDRAYVVKFDDYVDDVLQYTEMIKKKIGKLPLFLMGNSMGGCISAFASLRDKSFKGVLFISPMLGVLPEVAKPHLVAISKFLSKYLPKMPVPGEKLVQSTLSHYPPAIERYENDPYCYHGELIVNQAYECLQATYRVIEQSKQFDTPFLIVQSGDDRAVDPEAARTFYENAKSKDKKFSLYKGAYHHLTEEPEEFDGGGKRANQELLQWILDRI